MYVYCESMLCIYNGYIIFDKTTSPSNEQLRAYIETLVLRAYIYTPAVLSFQSLLHVYHPRARRFFGKRKTETNYNTIRVPRIFSPISLYFPPVNSLLHTCRVQFKHTLCYFQLKFTRAGYVEHRRAESTCIYLLFYPPSNARVASTLVAAAFLQSPPSLRSRGI